MRKAVLVLLCGCLVFAVSARQASAIKPFFDEFKAKYVKKEGSDAEKEFAKKVEMVKCAVCHGKKDGKEDKKVRNDYGKALDILLDKKADAKNKEKIQKSLDTVYDEKVPGKDETFGDRIKAGKLPGAE
ncbi:MAG TPA: hypothetical protein VMV69_20755 [Pirellulales bacterium]|nr:hypothetical protein [Pirellulales bacterium]